MVRSVQVTTAIATSVVLILLMVRSRPKYNSPPNATENTTCPAHSGTESVSPRMLPEADQDAAWNHIRLDDAPYTEG
ncbi:MAG: hypothetical protein AAFY33_11100 [Cyanobacteria bacterium J06643_4]